MLNYLHAARRFIVVSPFIWMISIIASGRQEIICRNRQPGAKLQAIMLTPCSENGNTLTKLVLDYLGKETLRLSKAKPYKVHDHADKAVNSWRKNNDLIPEALQSPFLYSASSIYEKEEEPTVFVTHVRGDEQKKHCLAYSLSTNKNSCAKGAVDYFRYHELPPEILSSQKEYTDYVRDHFFGNDLADNTDASFFPVTAIVVTHDERYTRFWETTKNPTKVHDLLNQLLPQLLSGPENNGK